MQNSDGMNYAPQGKPAPVVKAGEFIFACAALDHGHIYGMTNGLKEAGGTLKYVYDPDPKKVAAFLENHPGTPVAGSLEQILEDPSVHMVASAAVTSKRGALGVTVLNAGKDYFTDKAPFTTLDQIDAAKAAVARTGKKYMVYYSERLHVESAVFAGQLIQDGVIGKVLQVLGTGPHRLSAASRPDWFFLKENYGGILCDIGSHQIEQFLFFANEKDASVVHSQIANYAHPEYPELEDFGDATLVGTNGATNYFRVDWFTPDGLGTWGDGRTFILGTKGFIELRKYINIGVANGGGHVFLATNDTEQYINVSGNVGYPFFGELILDCLNRTEIAMTQAHAFKAGELCVRAEMAAVRIR